MATKAEDYKAEMQRKAHAAQKKAVPPRPRSKMSRPNVPNPAAHNTSLRAGKNSPYELEVSATTRPSRKSTRRSFNRLKPDNPLRIAAVNEVVSPRARAGRGKG